jgi:hypothetical protein
MNMNLLVGTEQIETSVVMENMEKMGQKVLPVGQCLGYYFLSNLKEADLVSGSVDGVDKHDCTLDMSW